MKNVFNKAGGGIMARGSWELKTSMWNDASDEQEDVELDDSDRDHIGEMIKEGYTSGLLLREDQN